VTSSTIWSHEVLAHILWQPSLPHILLRPMLYTWPCALCVVHTTSRVTIVILTLTLIPTLTLTLP